MTNDMVVGRPMNLILKFSMPIIIGNIFQQFYTIVDSIVVGRYVGVSALAAVGAAGSLILFLLGMITGMTSGFSILIAQSYGAKNQSQLRHYFGMSVNLCIGLTIFLTIGSVVFLKISLRLMQTPTEIFQDSYDYMLIVCLGTITTVAYNMISGVLRAIGDSKNPLYILIFSSIIHVGFDLLFILGFSMGVKGAAYATVIAQLIASILALIIMVKKYPFLKLSKEDFRFSFLSARKLLGMGIPMALQFSITSIGTMIVQAALNSFGAVFIAAFSAAGKIQTVVMQTFVALGATMSTYVGQNMGAGNIERIRKGVKSCFILSVVSGILLGMLVYFFGEAFVGFFISKPDAEVLEGARKFFHAVGWFYPILSLIFLYRNTLQGLGFGLVPMLGGVLELFARAIVVLTLPSIIGYDGICLAHPIAWTSAIILLIPYYNYRMKRLYKCR